IPQEAGNAVMVSDERLGLAIEVERGDPGLDGARELGEAGAEDLPGDPHLLDLIGPLQPEAVDRMRAHPVATGAPLCRSDWRIRAVMASMSPTPSIASIRVPAAR